MEDKCQAAPWANTPGMRDWTAWPQEELEQQYSPSRWSPHTPQSRIIPEYVAAATRDIAACRANCSWSTHTVAKLDSGDSDIVMDVYGDNLPAGSGVLVYVHGGYWQQLGKDLVGGVMGPLCGAGVVVVVLQYTTAPHGRVRQMVQEVCRGVLQAQHLALQRNWGPAVLMGWSAGAQLVLQAMLHFDADTKSTSSPSSGRAGPECDVSWIRGVVTVSGVFLLTPLVDTYVNTPLGLSKSEAWQLSPLNIGNCKDLRSRANHQPRFLIAVADNDSPSFKEQSLAYAQMLRSAGFSSVAELTVTSSDHFRIVSELANPSNFFSQELLKFLRLCCSN